MFSNDQSKSPFSNQITLTNKNLVLFQKYISSRITDNGKSLILDIETPNNGEVNKITAGTNPIKVLIKAVKFSRDAIISFKF